LCTVSFAKLEAVVDSNGVHNIAEGRLPRKKRDVLNHVLTGDGRQLAPNGFYAERWISLLVGHKGKKQLHVFVAHSSVLPLFPLQSGQISCALVSDRARTAWLAVGIDVVFPAGTYGLHRFARVPVAPLPV